MGEWTYIGTTGTINNVEYDNYSEFLCVMKDGRESGIFYLDAKVVPIGYIKMANTNEGNWVMLYRETNYKCQFKFRYYNDSAELQALVNNASTPVLYAR